MTTNITSDFALDMTTAKARRLHFGQLWDANRSVRDKSKQMGMSRKRYLEEMELRWARQQSSAVVQKAQA